MTQEFVKLPREVVEQALDAFVKLQADDEIGLASWDFAEAGNACFALRAALEQPQAEQEPVAWQYRMRPDWGIKKDCWGPWQDCTREQAAMYQRVQLLHDWVYESRQLYTRPQPKRQPLTDDQHERLMRGRSTLEYGRSVERAHGIK